MLNTLKSLLAVIAIAAPLGTASAESLQLAQNEYRIIVPRVGSMDPKVYPPVSRESIQTDCNGKRWDIYPSPDTGYGTPGSPMASPGQRIPGKLREFNK